jgi:hypothetical protein
MTTNFFSPLSFVAVFGSGFRDPGSGMGNNQDPGSGNKHTGSATLSKTGPLCAESAREKLAQQEAEREQELARLLNIHR